MPEQNPESKPSEKPEEKPSTPPEGTQLQGQPRQGRGGRQYVDYNTLSPGEAAIMLKRIRARMKRIIGEIDRIMNILNYGANAGTPSQGQGQAQQGQSGYQGGYSRGYRRSNYSGGRGSYGSRGYGGRSYGRRYSKRTSNEEDEDVNY
jgi:hypothetical protein